MKLAVNPFGVVEVSELLCLVYPFRVLMVTVEVPEVPALMVIGFGEAEIEKSGDDLRCEVGGNWAS